MTVRSIIITIASMHADSADLTQEETRNIKLNPKTESKECKCVKTPAHTLTCVCAHTHTQL